MMRARVLGGRLGQMLGQQVHLLLQGSQGLDLRVCCLLQPSLDADAGSQGHTQLGDKKKSPHCCSTDLLQQQLAPHVSKGMA